jgi:iron complex transport system substrate-binding protein
VTVSDRDGWDAITAVQNGSVIEMDDDIASRWGPRIVEYAQAIAAAIAQVNQPA